MAEADRVVAGGSAGRPPRRLGGEQCGRFFPVVEVLEGERGLPPGYAGCVAEDVTHLDVLLAVRSEFRPVLCDRREGIEQPAVDQDQSGQGGHVLGARKDVDDGVFGPLDGFRLIGIPAPDVDDQLAVDVDRNGGTQFPAGVDLFSQRGRDVGETVVATAMDHAGGGKGVERVGSHWVSFLTQGVTGVDSTGARRGVALAVAARLYSRVAENGMIASVRNEYVRSVCSDRMSRTDTAAAESGPPHEGADSRRKRLRIIEAARLVVAEKGFDAGAAEK